MVTTSSQEPILGRDSRKTDTPKTMTEMVITAAVREKCSRLDRASLHASIMFTREVIPAKKTEMKKMMAKSCPAGIF